MAIYTENAAFWLSGFVFTISAIILVLHLLDPIRRYTRREIYFYFIFVAIAFGFLLLGIFVGISLPLLIGFILSKIRPFSWFSHPLFSVALYGFWSLLSIVASQWAHSAVMKRKFPEISSESLSQHTFWASHVIWLILYVIATVARMSGAFYAFFWCLLPVGCVSLGTWMLDILYKKRKMLPKIISRRIKSTKTSHGSHWWVTLPLGNLFPTLIMMEGIITFLGTIIPITGRLPTLPGDVVIAALVAVLFQLEILLFSPLIYRIGHYAKTTGILGFACVLVVVMAIFLPPFSSGKPLRLESTHVWFPQSQNAYISVRFLSNPQYKPAIENVTGIISLEDQWMVPNVGVPPQTPPTVIQNHSHSSQDSFPRIPDFNLKRQISNRVVFDITTYNASGWNLVLKPSHPLASIEVNGNSVNNSTVEMSKEGTYVVSQTIGFQDWSGNTTIQVAVQSQASVQLEVQVEIDTYYQQDSPQLLGVLAQLPDWTTQTTKWLTRISMNFTFSSED
eukprot:TRINITY_DN6405_c0_g1_i1.p1 TRINITY_DN6405_c0_g1~~TRINITY_DN6405_c0_g1_i1.p1  ORF type:complete len:506 (-),score=104.91 TRINITY_DN6405_c0_g1_i1:19-1536(-)